VAGLRYMTAGESHGPGLTAILEGLPAGLPLSAEPINTELARRQRGYGRGGRMLIEQDTVQITGGVRGGLTLGSPVALVVANRDWENWRECMSVEAWAAGERPAAVRTPRPGHADLAGLAKYGQRDLRNILERASARETAARVAVGAACREFLRELGVQVGGYVSALGGVEAAPQPEGREEVWRQARESDVACPDETAAGAMRAAIDAARERGDSVGGRVRVEATGVPPGLGAHVAWEQRLDGRLAQALMSIPAIKAVEIGLGRAAGSRPGSQVHDPILPRPGAPDWPFTRPTNHAGGVEGGLSNGEPLVVEATMKPIPTLLHALPSVDLDTGQSVTAHVERSDVCAVPAALVVAEAMVCFVLAQAAREKFGGDSLAEAQANLAAYRVALARLWGPERDA
jgi:chorismate synthase